MDIINAAGSMIFAMVAVIGILLIIITVLRSID